MTVLHGPADASHYRVQVGRYRERWYVDPLPACPVASADDTPRPAQSIVKKASGNDWSFVSVRRTAEGAVGQDYTDATFEEVLERFRGFDRRGLNLAADRGSIVHLWVHQMLHGEMPETDPLQLALHLQSVVTGALDEALLYLPAVEAFFDQYQPELVASEYPVFQRTLHDVGYGATPDGLVRIDGSLCAWDIKTRGASSDHGAYPEEGAQIAAGAKADYMIVEDDNGPRRMAIPRVDVGLVVSVKPQGVRIYPVDIDKAWRHWEAMHTWWCARRNERDAIGRAWAPRSSSVERTTGGAAPEAAAGGEAPLPPSPPAAPFTDDQWQWLMDRIDTIKTVDGARNLLRGFWPEGVPPTSRRSEWTLEHFTAVVDIVRMVENEHTLPFPPLEPKEPPTAPDEPEPPRARPVPDEGPEVDMTPLIEAHARLDENLKAIVGSLVKEAKRAGVDFRPSVAPTERRLELGRLCLTVASHEVDGELLRHLWAAVVGEEPQESVTTGALLGSCDAPTARRIHEALHAVLGGTASITFTTAGRPALMTRAS